jgi:hypothetical protein
MVSSVDAPSLEHGFSDYARMKPKPVGMLLAIVDPQTLNRLPERKQPS